MLLLIRAFFLCFRCSLVRADDMECLAADGRFAPLCHFSRVHYSAATTPVTSNRNTCSRERFHLPRPHSPLPSESIAPKRPASILASATVHSALCALLSAHSAAQGRLCRSLTRRHHLSCLLGPIGRVLYPTQRHGIFMLHAASLSTRELGL